MTTIESPPKRHFARGEAPKYIESMIRAEGGQATTEVLIPKWTKGTGMTSAALLFHLGSMARKNRLERVGRAHYKLPSPSGVTHAIVKTRKPYTRRAITPQHQQQVEHDPQSLVKELTQSAMQTGILAERLTHSLRGGNNPLTQIMASLTGGM